MACHRLALEQNGQKWFTGKARRCTSTLSYLGTYGSSLDLKIFNSALFNPFDLPICLRVLRAFSWLILQAILLEQVGTN